MSNKEYIEREALNVAIHESWQSNPHNNQIARQTHNHEHRRFLGLLHKQPTADVVEVRQIKEYLQSKLDEWNALGDRKFEPANMWGYNFIMACFDDLAKMDGKEVDNDR